ncbi:sensor histidine kinase [Gordoniibacillus kamchatkensis]|uniref:sensor histidine kinase n=1 Tax=Gordoniibacillus kamchatkensis TaxID=1590651 RepID=UPI000A4B09DF|nr:sensor histidine kinase [Paenibacillus sp. VKM B-2647]
MEGPFLQGLRFVWLAAAAVFLYIYLDSLRLRWWLYDIVCDQYYIGCSDYYQLNGADAKVLYGWGVLGAYKWFQIACDGLVGAVYFLVAALVFLRNMKEVYGLFVAYVLLASGAIVLVDSLRAYPPMWGWAVPWFQVIHVGYWALVFTFPNGRFVPRWSVALALGYAALAAAGLTVPRPDWPAGAIATQLVIYAVALYAQIRRYREAKAHEQLQIRWFVCAIVFVVVTGVWDQFWVTNRGIGPIVGSTIAFSIAHMLVPVSIGIAIVKYQLWSIRSFAGRATVYMLLSACVVGIYVLVVGFFGMLLQNRGNFNWLASFLATGLIAVLFQPLRVKLQAIVNQVLYGNSGDPYEILSGLGQRLEAIGPQEEVLTTVVETVAQVLKLPYVAISLQEAGRHRVVAAHGEQTFELHAFPLIYQSDIVGALRVSTRGPDEPFTAKEMRLIADLARQIGGTVNSARVTLDLVRSRERLVLAREEERRRLRRDLHDGLGPTLAGLTLQFDVARSLVRGNPERAEELLANMRVQLQLAISDIRRVVYALRPPALDELGLVAALRQQAAQYPGERVQIAVAGPEPLPPLPAAVEVAAFRIGQEAMNNVVRHAEASRCDVRLWLDDWLHLVVSDDGKGLPDEEFTPGVGLHSMRERAEEVGGVIEVFAGYDHGPGRSPDAASPAAAALAAPVQDSGDSAAAREGTTVYVRLPVRRFGGLEGSGGIVHGGSAAADLRAADEQKGAVG